MCRPRVILVALATFLVALLATAGSASAAVGQIESWGSFGTGNGQFSSPGMLGVDTSDGSVFVGDLTKEGATKDREFFRIQKLSSTGTFQAAVEIPRYQNSPTDTKPVYLWGIAVDPSLHRFYLLEGQAEKETFGEPVAKRILVFSTIPKEGKLVAPEGGPSTLPVPTGTNFVEGLFKPKGIQVDPSNHDLVVMAENKSSPKHTLFQRISSAGVIGAKFSDAANVLRPTNETAVSFAVGPNGTVYTITGRGDKAAKEHTRAWEIPPAFSSIGQVPGFAAAIDSEESPFGALTILAVPPSKFFGGPEIAISPDGGTLYWQDSIEQSEKPTTAGNTLVHGFSLAGKATAVTYGGGEKGKCRIESSGSGLATIGEEVVVFDYGPLNEEKSESPAYGDKVLTFGPGGSGCNPPIAKFKANGTEGNVKIKKGETVSFDASGSELASGPSKTAGFRKELIWKFGDGTEKVVTGEGAGEAPATVTHQYTSAGNFKATLQIHLKNPTWGNPVLVEHGVEVEGEGAKSFKLSLTIGGTGTGTVTSSPAGINCATATSPCSAEFAESTLVKLTGTPGAGSKAVAWTNCDKVNGSNECEVTMSAAKNVTATFDLQLFALKVTPGGTGSGTVTSSPSGINCGSTCEANFKAGTLVKLTGAPNAGSKAVTWGGCDSVNGANECEVTMSAAKNVTATFDLIPLFKLSLTIGGTGTGTVTSSPAGINCATATSPCSAEFAESTLVKLTGTPGAGSKAVAWSGCDKVNGSNECEVTMSAAKAVTATFDLQLFTLKVTKGGTGTGTVTSSPSGISCGSTCEANFKAGTLVKLTGAPDPGSKAVKWTGCDSVNGSNECEVTMSAAKEVTATFDLIPVFALKVTKGGTGTGTVTSSPSGINCGPTCEANFQEGTLVKLTGAPDPGSKAVAWSGCDKVNGSNECEVTMSAAKNVTATFDLQLFTLKVTKGGTGTGTVTSSPSGINCGSTCEANFKAGTLVKLTGAPNAGSKAVVWGNCDSVNGANECEVTMSAAKAVTATFDQQKFALNVVKNGSGTGTVTSSPSGINCGSTCEASFSVGTLVKLTGTADAGSKAVKWTGCDKVNGSNECEVTMSAAKEVTATFDAVGQFQLKVTKNGTGTGTVTSSPSGINCGSTCEANFAEGTLVKLTGTPGAGSEPVVWETCPGTVNGSNQCEVTMNASKEAVATFAAVPPAEHKLKVTVGGTGTGTVTSSPSGINCGPTCEASFAEGTLVKLTGSPNPGSKAVVWGGCDNVNGANECEVTMSAAKAVTATFDLVPPNEHVLKVTKNGTGTGTVTSSPSGINCGPTCEASFQEGKLVKLTGAPAAGSKAVVWSGCDTVNGSNECEVTVNDDTTVTATFDLETAPPINCTGSDITGEGSTLQGVAQQQVWIPGFGSLCPGLKVSYESTGSSAGLKAWDFNGPDGTPFDTSRAFVATDDAPSAAQIGNGQTAAGGAKALVIPVAQTSIAVIVNPPANCEIEEITNKELETVFRGIVKNWGKLDTATGAGCVGAPITRVVRPAGSGTTYQFKNYLYRINKAALACTAEGGKTWQQLEEIGAADKPNVDWPENEVGGCGKAQLSPVARPAGNTGADLVAKVNTTDGSIGYAALPDVEGGKAGDTHWLALQNNGLVKLANAAFAKPTTGASGANCAAARYAVPAGARVNGGSGESVDWSQAFGANLLIDSENYPLCTLTFDVALNGYGKAGLSAGQATTARAYLDEYILAPVGQSAIEAAGKWYAPLPSSSKPERNVLGAAQLTASKIAF